MNIHYLQHVAFEGLSSMLPALQSKGHELSATLLYENQALPPVSSFDWLIIMGGPMSIHDENEYPWLKAEKAFIKAAIDAGKIVMGICLGAQLIADALGAKVYKNKHKEIGWFNITPTPSAKDTVLSDALSETTKVFHWHGDTFEIPEGATRIAESEACKNQGFILNNKIIAFQFHLESTRTSASALIQYCSDEIDDSKYVQSAGEMLSDDQRFENINQTMLTVLKKIEAAHAI